MITDCSWNYHEQSYFVLVDARISASEKDLPVSANLGFGFSTRPKPKYVRAMVVH